MKKQVTSVKTIVSELRKTRAPPDSGLECLEAIADTDISQFLKRFIQNQKNVTEKGIPKRQSKCQRKNKGLGISSKKYPPALRAFAMTLHFYSPKAYGFVRHRFCKALSEPSTLRAWYSSIHGEPGFTLESFEALKVKVAEVAEVRNKKVLVSFMIDEISIKKSIQRQSNGVVRGYVDVGTKIECSDTIPIAKDALVRWKLKASYRLLLTKRNRFGYQLWSHN